jgi:hypothetical protein
MAETYRWTDRDGERLLFLDPPATAGARYLAVRRVGPDDWTAACVLVPGEPEREIGDGLVEASVGEDVILKFAIQALARIHGVSPSPGMPDEEAGEPEMIIARLWRLLTERWAPPGT